MFWTLELASHLEDAPWPATKDDVSTPKITGKPAYSGAEPFGLSRIPRRSTRKAFSKVGGTPSDATTQATGRRS